MMAHVSVIIPAWNRADRLPRAIDSVLTQTYQDIEIVVVDDGSTDETREVLKSFGQHIRTIIHPVNLGVSAARNTGIQNTFAPFVAFLDSDDHWLPGKLQTQTAFFENHPSALICQTDEIWIRNGCRVNPKNKHKKPSGDIFVSSLGLCLVSPSAVMMKRTLLDAVGLFDESLPACEDYDLWLRIASRHPVYLIEEYLIYKEGGHADQLSARYMGMDRFRIKSLVKLINDGELNHHQKEKAMAMMTRKCEIHGNGCLKRGKIKEGDFFLQLPDKIKQGLSLDESFFKVSRT